MKIINLFLLFILFPLVIINCQSNYDSNGNIIWYGGNDPIKEFEERIAKNSGPNLIVRTIGTTSLSSDTKYQIVIKEISGYLTYSFPNSNERIKYIGEFSIAVENFTDKAIRIQFDWNIITQSPDNQFGPYHACFTIGPGLVGSERCYCDDQYPQQSNNQNRHEVGDNAFEYLHYFEKLGKFPATAATQITSSIFVNGQKCPNNLDISNQGKNDNSKANNRPNDNSSNYSSQQYFSAGATYYNNKDYNSAVQCFNKAIELNPNSADAYNFRGSSKLGLNDIQGSIQDYNKAIELNPNYANAYNNRGVSKYRLMDKNGACLDWNQAAKLGYKVAIDNLKEYCDQNSNSDNKSQQQKEAEDPCLGISTVIYAGKTYHTVKIGNQCWFQENLDVGRMIKGTETPSNNGEIEKYCYNDDPNNCAKYGGLYTWDEAMLFSKDSKAQGICPDGWHIPTEEDFETLKASVNNDGNALKANGSNTSDFSALLVGSRINGSFDGGGFTAIFWSSTEYEADYAYYLYNLSYDDSKFGLYNNGSRGNGFSVRCLKD